MKMSDLLNKITIKQLNREDATEEIAHALWEVVNSGFSDESPWSEQQLLSTLKVVNSIVLVATIPIDAELDTKEEIIGLIVASTTEIERDIYLIVVSEEYKQLGVGSKLFNYLIKDSEDVGIETIILEVRVSNQPAIALYQKIGFEEVGLRKGYYSSPIEDAIVMKWEP